MSKISSLIDFPEELLCSHILTRLPLKEVVRFSAVSRKWYKTWTRLQRLSFSLEFYDSICNHSRKRKVGCELTPQNTSIINKIITMQCAKVEIFELYKCESCRPNLHDWTFCISVKNVKRIHFECSNTSFAVEVPASLYSCETIRSLSLKNLKMTKVPALFHGFSQLVTLYLEKVELGEEAFELLERSCCLLQGLMVSHCEWPTKWMINSSSLKSLSLNELNSFCSMETNCSRLQTIKVTYCHGLEKMRMYLPLCVHLQTDFQLLQQFVSLKSLRKITCYNSNFRYICDIVLLQRFPQLKELCIDIPFYMRFSRTQTQELAKLTLSLGKLETLILNIDAREGYYKGYVALLSCIMRSAPLLKTVRVGMDDSLENSKLHIFNGVQLVNHLLNLQIRSSQTIILVSKGRITPSWQHS